MLIRCPECGGQVSDKAPVCPHCGVELQQVLNSGNNGQNGLNGSNGVVVNNPLPQTPNPLPQTPNPQPQTPQTPQTPAEPERKRGASFWLCIVMAVMICLGGAFWCYNEFFGGNAGEEEAYELAMQSDDLNVMQNYLIDFKDAPADHIQQVEARIEMINGLNREWNDVLVSGSRAALQSWVDQHPDGPFKDIALHKIDSLDYNSALKANTVEALKSYIDQHSNGDYVEEANNSIRDLQSNTIQPDEKQMVNSVVRSFFQSINSQDESQLTSNVNTLLNSFLGKSNATKGDVTTFMKKLWKSDVSNLNFALNNDLNVTKKEIGDGEYEYTANFSVVQHTEKVDGSQNETVYHVTCKLNTDGKITDLSMRK